MMNRRSLCLDIEKIESMSPSLGMSEMDVGLLSPFFSATTSSIDTLSELSFPAALDESSMLNTQSCLTTTASMPNANGCFNVSLLESLILLILSFRRAALSNPSLNGETNENLTVKAYFAYGIDE
jgi:hypothetical protein